MRLSATNLRKSNTKCMYGVNHFSLQLKVQRSGLRGAEISFDFVQHKKSLHLIEFGPKKSESVITPIDWNQSFNWEILWYYKNKGYSQTLKIILFRSCHTLVGWDGLINQGFLYPKKRCLIAFGILSLLRLVQWECKKFSTFLSRSNKCQTWEVLVIQCWRSALMYILRLTFYTMF